MNAPAKKIAVMGGGKIGSAIGASLRSRLGSDKVQVADKFSQDKDVIRVDAADPQALRQFLSGFDAVLCAMPSKFVYDVASAAVDLGVAYFDLTEDRDATERAKVIAAKSENVVVPQCGLAPGAVSIIAAHLMKSFDQVKSVDIRVGALPLFPNNSIKYYLTWSTDGLVNEYCNLCDAIYNGKRMEVMPMEGYEQISIDGATYEAFNTSGGIGSLCSSLAGKVDNLTYKTIRYVGHHHLMKFLLDDLNLNKNRELFIQLFDQEVPQTAQDMVVVMVKVVGRRNGKLFEETYQKKIYGSKNESAIQSTTLSGICGAMQSWATGDWRKKKGFVSQEEIEWSQFSKNPWGALYA